MNKLIAIAIFSLAITGCASTAPSASTTATTAGDYCKGQAQMAVNRVGMNQSQSSPMSGRSDPQEVRDFVYKDCLVKVTQR